MSSTSWIYENLDWFIFVALGAIVTSLLSGLIGSRLKGTRYNKDESRVLLDDVRSSIEKQLYSLNDRLIQSEEKWKDMNHLLINQRSDDAINLSTIEQEDFLKSNGVSTSDFRIEERLVFVLTPFNDRHHKEFLLIRDVCERKNFIASRGDETYIKGDVFPYMLKHITKAKIIIANINGRNPNVMYELGIAQALNKKVILLAENPNDIPFDIKSQKFLIYRSEDELKQKLESALDQLR